VFQHHEATVGRELARTEDVGADCQMDVDSALLCVPDAPSVCADATWQVGVPGHMTVGGSDKPVCEEYRGSVTVTGGRWRSSSMGILMRTLEVNKRFKLIRVLTHLAFVSIK